MTTTSKNIAATGLAFAFAALFALAQDSASANLAAKAAEVQKQAKALIQANASGHTANYNNDGYDQAIALLEATLKDEAYAPAQRIALMKDLAYACLDRAQDSDKADIAKGHAILEAATKLPDLSDAERLMAGINLADLLWSEYRRDEAAAMYEKLHATAGPGGPRSHLETRLVEHARETKGAAAALALYRDAFGHGADNRAMKKYYVDNGMHDRAYEIVVREIAAFDAKTPIAVLRNAAMDLFDAVSPRDLATLRAKFDPPYAKLAALDPRAGDSVFANIRVAYATWGNNGLFDAVSGPGTQAWWLDHYLASVSNSPSVFPAFVQARRHDLPAEKKMRFARLACAFAEQANATTRNGIRKDELRGAYLYPVLVAEEDADNAVKAVEQVIAKTFPAAVTNAAEKADIYREAARLEYEFGREDLSRRLLAVRESMRAPRKNAEYACTFVSDMPSDLPSILASDAFKKLPRGLLDKKYGQNLQFLLETDVMSGARMIGADDGISAPTEFTAWADRFGFKVLLRSYEKNTAEIRAGFAQPVGYEMYLAPSLEAPYHCFLDHAAAKDGLLVNFCTQYTGPNHHVLLSAKSVRSSYQILDDGVAMLMDFPWSTFYGFVPKNGDLWHFETIHWVAGGMTWGGSESVHNRSSWGVLKWAGMTPEATTAIKRALLPLAADNYRNALSFRANGCIDHWMDNELGDRDFWLTALKPFIAEKKWDADLALVKPDMSDADAIRIFDAAAEDWMNIQEVVSRLRTDYLLKKRLGE